MSIIVLFPAIFELQLNMLELEKDLHVSHASHAALMIYIAFWCKIL
jgi:hypothetical protein